MLSKQIFRVRGILDPVSAPIDGAPYDSGSAVVYRGLIAEIAASGAPHPGQSSPDRLPRSVALVSNCELDAAERIPSATGPQPIGKSHETDDCDHRTRPDWDAPPPGRIGRVASGPFTLPTFSRLIRLFFRPSFARSSLSLLLPTSPLGLLLLATFPAVSRRLGLLLLPAFSLSSFSLLLRPANSLSPFSTLTLRPFPCSLLPLPALAFISLRLLLLPASPFSPLSTLPLAALFLFSLLPAQRLVRLSEPP
ncbi:MAG: hypothetical protein OXH75_12585 [Acidobacteria bacterium]|nr:hypothetical protein [Acidobacteriota bacterium]